MSDIDIYRKVNQVKNICKVLGISFAFEGADLVLFSDQEGSRRHRFKSMDEAKAFLDGYRTAIEYGREPGCKL